MRVSKEHADRMAREFRANLNKSAREGLIYESFFYTKKGTIHFAVEVRANSSDCFDCHKGSYGESEGKDD